MASTVPRGLSNQAICLLAKCNTTILLRHWSIITKQSIYSLRSLYQPPLRDSVLTLETTLWMGSVPEGPNLSSSCFQKHTRAFPGLGEVGSGDPENRQWLEIRAPALSWH